MKHELKALTQLTRKLKIFAQQFRSHLQSLFLENEGKAFTLHSGLHEDTVQVIIYCKNKA